MFLELFKDLEPDVTLNPEEILFMEKSKADKAYVVHSGHVELSVRGTELTSVGPDEIIGEMALVDGAPRSAMAVAGTDGAKLFSIDEARFLGLVGNDPGFSIKVMKIMADRLRRWGDLLD